MYSVRVYSAAKKYLPEGGLLEQEWETRENSSALRHNVEVWKFALKCVHKRSMLEKRVRFPRPRTNQLHSFGMDCSGWDLPLYKTRASGLNKDGCIAEGIHPCVENITR